MPVDNPAAVLGFIAMIATVVAWGVNIQTRTRSNERRVQAVEANSRIILRGLVRVGVVRQEDVDALDKEREMEAS